MKNVLLLLCGVAGLAALAEGTTSAELNAKWGKPGCVSFADDRRGDPVATLSNKHGTCSVALRGAKLSSWVPAGGEEVFFVPAAGIDCKVANWQSWVHGGMPVVWPWFGSNGIPVEGWWARKMREWGFSDRPAPCIHGFARYSLFEVKDVVCGDDATRLKLRMIPREDSREWFPHEYELDYEITLGKDLALSLSTRNSGNGDFSIREGYHPYFKVANGYHTAVRGFDGRKYTWSNRKLEFDLTHVWEGDLPIGPGCDVFDMGAAASKTALLDPRMGRQIKLDATGGRDVLTCFFPVNPWADRDENLLNTETKSTVCLEPANFNQPVVVKAGETHVFAMTISVEKFEK
ncbi:MAG: hypothetical protein MJ138_01930 [Kiritimatiellae bacterium]|nr:hypothetical protein [Kiritimatiellia bacterium]